MNIAELIRFSLEKPSEKNFVFVEMNQAFNIWYSVTDLIKKNVDQNLSEFDRFRIY